MTGDKLKEIMYEQGRADALDLQKRSPSLTGTELNAEDDKIPSFKAAVGAKNMMERMAGQTDGFICKSTAGRVVRLIQNYDSTIYLHEDGTPWEPEELTAQWRFVWSTDPAKALPFVAISTSPYGIGDCCTENGSTYRSLYANNVSAPSTWPDGWEEVAV